MHHFTHFLIALWVICLVLDIFINISKGFDKVIVSWFLETFLFAGLWALVYLIHALWLATA